MAHPGGNGRQPNGSDPTRQSPNGQRRTGESLGFDAAFVDPRTFEQAFGESLDDLLDLHSWPTGGDMLSLYHQLEREIHGASDDERRTLAGVRQSVLPRIRDRPGRPEAAGIYRVSVDDLRRVHETVLFNGGVEACRSTVASHDTLALTITQLGVTLVNYQGDRGTWGHRLLRRDVRLNRGSIEDLAMEAIFQRQRSAGQMNEHEQQLSLLARRGILAFAERSALVDQSTAPWRMGAGQPVPFELITGSGSMRLAQRGVEVLSRLLLAHRRFVYVSTKSPERGMLTIGAALRPLEYAVIDTSLTRLRSLADSAGYTRNDRQAVDHFVAEAGPHLLIGVYRASEIGPPRVFYGHAEHIHEAALIAIADSVLHEHRAYPLLLDLAEQVCRSTFPPGDLSDVSDQAWLNAGMDSRTALMTGDIAE